MRAALVCTLMLAGVRAAPCQQLFSMPVDSGVLVRFTSSDSGTMRARLLLPLRPSDSLLVGCRYPANPCRLGSDAGVRRVQVARISTLEVGRGSRLVKGMVIGSLIGTGLGLLFYEFARGVCDDSRCLSGAERGAVIPVVLFGAIGAGIGSGSVVWTRAP
jgi:hypothetical protein